MEIQEHLNSVIISAIITAKEAQPIEESKSSILAPYSGIFKNFSLNLIVLKQLKRAISSPPKILINHVALILFFILILYLRSQLYASESPENVLPEISARELRLIKLYKTL